MVVHKMMFVFFLSTNLCSFQSCLRQGSVDVQVSPSARLSVPHFGRGGNVLAREGCHEIWFTHNPSLNSVTKCSQKWFIREKRRLCCCSCVQRVQREQTVSSKCHLGQAHRITLTTHPPGKHGNVNCGDTRDYILRHLTCHIQANINFPMCFFYLLEFLYHELLYMIMYNSVQRFRHQK